MKSENDNTQLGAQGMNFNCIPGIHFAKPDPNAQLERLTKEWEQLEIEASREKCSQCGQLYNPSIVESGWCIFCIQKDTKAKLDAAQAANTALRRELSVVKEDLRDAQDRVQELEAT